MAGLNKDELIGPHSSLVLEDDTDESFLKSAKNFKDYKRVVSYFLEKADSVDAFEEFFKND